MADSNPSRLGQINGSGATDALFLQKFAGEVLTTFSSVNVMMERHLVRTITEGKSAQFPATGIADAYDHTPGTELTGRSIKHAERILTLDGLIVSDVFIANIDEAMNHYDVRSIYTTEVARALSKKMDKNVLQTAILAARASAVITGNPGGTVLNAGAGVVTNSNGALRSALFSAAQALDEKDVPEDSRFVVLKPAQYYTLVTDPLIPNRDYSANAGADIRTGKVWEVAGIDIVKSNNLPSTNVNTGNTKYQVDATNTVGVVMHPSAIGTLKLMDLAVEGEYQLSKQGTLIVAKYATGHGVLRPECAVEITKSA
ncbi:MAG TPA: phage capsid protein [Roseomonas sp.]|nr:phage capsid protein [Roseomonas sp.]